MRKGLVRVKGVRLRAFRDLAKLSQAGLAAKATQHLRDDGDPEGSVSESLIALIETDRRQPSLRNAEAIAKALGVDVEALADIDLTEASA